MAYKLKLDPVLVLRDPVEQNYWLRLAAADVISRAEREEAEKHKQDRKR